MTSNEAIIEYYERCEVHYKMHWNLDESLALHYGYWDETTKSFHEALMNTNKKLASIAEVQTHDRLLDMGCGIGGSSIYLAKETGCECVGISLSEKQIQTATRMAHEFGVADECTFLVRDFTDTNFKDQSFDVVWAVESVCHANQKEKFIEEAWRLLKPGGRLILADFLQTKEDLNAREQYIMDNWALGWAVPFFETESQFKNLLKAQGFGIDYYENATDHIQRSARRLYLRFFPGWVGAKLYRLFNPGSSVISMENVWTAYYQYKGLQKGLWEYGIILATKNI
ncbi:MAG: methyltransferase domain-containing protein [Bacteroidia bacterium]|nr:methyltransferase domain-containing protein [Bacteroidia bacterium]